jgi:imidazolonepropionase
MQVPKKIRTKATLVVKNIGQLVTITGSSSKPVVRPSKESLGVLHGPGICVAARNHRICYIGYSKSMSEAIDFSEAKLVDAKGALVLPGFVDAHTHCIFYGSRENELAQKLQGLSYLEILSKGGGILRTVRETRNASDEEIIEQTRARLDRMVKSGTTTVEVKSGYGLNLGEEIRLLSILNKLRTRFGYDIVPTLLSAHAMPSEFEKPKEYIKQVVYPSVDAAKKEKLASFFDVFLEEGVFSRKDCKAMLEYAKKRGFALKIHADEFSDLGGAELAAQIHAVSADHLLRASKANLELLALSGTIAVLLPGTSLASFSPNYADARTIIDSGGAVALGTDLSPNSWIESMHLVICLACYCMKMKVEESIVGATINAAHAIGRAKDVGSIELGKRCDLVLTNLKDYNEVPYRIGSNIVEKVVKNGAIVKN